MRKNPLKINELKFLNEFFDGEMCICGGIADFFYTGYDDIADIDILVSLSAFMESMEINSLIENQNIIKYNFDITHIPDSFFSDLSPSRYFYAGNYKKYPIDIFIVNQLTDTVFLPDLNTRKNGIKVTSLHDRIHKLTKTINTKIDSSIPKSSVQWVHKKQNQAKIKLKLYKKLYPDIYDTFYC